MAERLTRGEGPSMHGCEGTGWERSYIRGAEAEGRGSGCLGTDTRTDSMRREREAAIEDGEEDPTTYLGKQA